MNTDQQFLVNKLDNYYFSEIIYDKLYIKIKEGFHKLILLIFNFYHMISLFFILTKASFSKSYCSSYL
jgi:hypothetical protein